MVGHQTIAKKVKMWQHEFPHFFEKEQIVLLFVENLLPVISLIEYVINQIFFEDHIDLFSAVNEQFIKLKVPSGLGSIALSLLVVVDC